MQIEQRDVGDVAILSMSGKIVIGDGDVMVREKVTDLLGSGTNKLLMQLENVNYMDSSGVGELLRCCVSTNNQGGQMKLLKPTPRVMEILSITMADSMFEIFDDEVIALASFA